MTVFENWNSGWTPEITLRANLVGCPLYWKFKCKLVREEQLI